MAMLAYNKTHEFASDNGKATELIWMACMILIDINDLHLSTIAVGLKIIVMYTR
jgi:hypothetical protein